MAKKRNDANELPPGAPQPEPPETKKVEKPVEDGPPTDVVHHRSVTVSELTVRLPSLEGVGGYSKRRIDVQFATAKQADFWKAVTTGLQDKQERLANGKFVRSPSDAVKWIAENAVSQ